MRFKGQNLLSDRCRLGARLPVERRHTSQDIFSTLTDRELHVFRLIGARLGTARIAKALGLSGKTIETYWEHIKVKLGYRDGKELGKGAIPWAARAEK